MKKFKEYMLPLSGFSKEGREMYAFLDLEHRITRSVFGKVHTIHRYVFVIFLATKFLKGFEKRKIKEALCVHWTKTTP